MRTAITVIRIFTFPLEMAAVGTLILLILMPMAIYIVIRMMIAVIFPSQ